MRAGRSLNGASQSVPTERSDQRDVKAGEAGDEHHDEEAPHGGVAHHAPQQADGARHARS